MRFLVTGCAGFIGSHMTERLLQKGHWVIGVDNFSTGIPRFLNTARQSERFRFFQRDLTKPNALKGILSKQIDWVIHLAANADVRDGLNHPTKDLYQNAQATLFVLEAMRKSGVRRIAFSSTGSVYGESSVIPTPENCPFPIQTSLYGASKVAAEGFISAYAEGCGFRALIFRFVSILGERYSHGHVFDFVHQLKRNSQVLQVLGNGKQRKSYLHIADCVGAIDLALHRAWPLPVEVFNLGTQEYIDVKESIRLISEEMNIHPRLQFSGGHRGWPGDNPFLFLRTSKMRSFGWKPQVPIRSAVRMTVRYLLANPWIFKERQAR